MLLMGRFAGKPFRGLLALPTSSLLFSASGIGALVFALCLVRLGGLKMEETLQDALETPPPPPFSTPLLGKYR